MKFGLVAGESSGDLLGAGLIRSLRERVPGAQFEGVAGPEMIAAGCERLEDADALAVMGLIEPLKEVPRLLRLRRSLAMRWIASPPDVFIGIDAPDFNLGLERRLRAGGVKTAHYVSPSVWAWRRRRIPKIRQACDIVLCILPFEPEFFAEHDISAVFVGHPKADSLADGLDRNASREALDMEAGGHVVAVLPGSRRSEVERLAPLFAGAAKRVLGRRTDTRFVTPVARPALRPVIESALDSAGVGDAFRLLDGKSELAMGAADVVLLASGTAALESALLCRPTVAAYKVAPLTAAIVRAFRMLKVNRFTLPNLLTKEDWVPEFIQEKATPEAVGDAVAALLDAPERRREIEDRFAKLRAELGRGADGRAAEAVLELAGHAATKTIRD